MAATRTASSSGLNRVPSADAKKPAPDDAAQEKNCIFKGWVKNFYNTQAADLKPWILCDGTTKYSYVEVTVKGARHNNEDASYADGKLFGVYDGHGGKHASILLRTKLAEELYSLIKGQDEKGLCLRGTPPKIVGALDTAYMNCQNAMPTEHPLAQSGSTAVAAWVASGPDGGACAVYASCLGDSKCLLFDSNTGEIPVIQTRVWDHEQNTLNGEGVEAVRRCETESHGLTGDIVIGKNGMPESMQNDPTGVAFREFELLRVKHKFSASRRPFNISNMPGEERWRVLELEPTRAVGHRLKKEHPLQHPEIFEWPIENSDSMMLLLSCDGFFSKEAFRTTDMVTEFLCDPELYCKRPDFFKGTCLEALLIKIKEVKSLPDPTKSSMLELFTGIHKVVFNKLSDDTWTAAYDSAFQYLKLFAADKPVDNIRTAPAKTLLAACYLAVLMVSDDNVSCSVVMLDGKPRFDGQKFELGHEA